MNPVVVTDPPRAAADQVVELAGYGVATVHEAAGRTGYLGPGLRPVYAGARACGTAVTVLCWPGDDLMIHVAVEQCRPGDVLVVTTSSPCHDGMFGDLLAASAAARGVRGLVIDAGVRDVADLRRNGFATWAAAISAQATVMATPGAVNVPVAIGGTLIHPGDAIVADDDGVVAVRRQDVPEVLTAAKARTAAEEAARAAFRAGELGLDRYGLRDRVAKLGIRYVTADQYAAEHGTP